MSCTNQFVPDKRNGCKFVLDNDHDWLISRLEVRSKNCIKYLNQTDVLLYFLFSLKKIK